MSLLVNSIKIKYSQEGYLPNYPYHLLSDKECMTAFLSGTVDKSNIVVNYSTMLDCFNNMSGYFVDTYIQPMKEISDYDTFPFDENYSESFLQLVSTILNIINSTDNIDELPYWIQCYMLGEVIGPSSNTRDIHDLLVLLDVDNLDDEFRFDSSYACYLASSKWIRKLDNENYRPPSPFGETHVIKYGRLNAS